MLTMLVVVGGASVCSTGSLRGGVRGAFFYRRAGAFWKSSRSGTIVDG